MSEKADKTGSLMQGGDNQKVQITTKFNSQDLDNVADIKSPYVYTTSVAGITVPVNAWEFIVNPNTLLHISDRQNFDSYDEIAANSKETFPCANIDVVYIRGGIVGGTINFRWHSL